MRNLLGNNFLILLTDLVPMCFVVEFCLSYSFVQDVKASASEKQKSMKASEARKKAKKKKKETKTSDEIVMPNQLDVRVTSTTLLNDVVLFICSNVYFQISVHNAQIELLIKIAIVYILFMTAVQIQ